jgi:predicted HTH transcriptional regulator
MLVIMSVEWNEEKVGLYIRDKIEESINLDYKAAGAIATEKTTEIIKDISAFANSAGGIIYGLRVRGQRQTSLGRKT